jgi:hypothetical protein
MIDILENNFCNWIILAFALVFSYICYFMICSDKRKPQYRLDKDGYVQFYYHKYFKWIDFPIWNDSCDDREVNIYDRIKNINYTLSYKGPGRVKFKLVFDDVDFISNKSITKYIREIYPEFKSSEQLYRLYTDYIDREDKLLKSMKYERP